MIFTCLLGGSLIGCYPGYQIDVDQGNLITSEQAANLELGMTRSEVQFVMGTALLRDPFHADRWDYFYTLTSGDKRQLSQNRLSLFFANDILVKIIENGNDS